MARALKIRASKQPYRSTAQLSFEEFDSGFAQNIPADNRWVRLAKQIPWDDIVCVYNRVMNHGTGARPINGRVAIGALMIKHIGSYSDEETIRQIQENICMQYFLGFSAFTTEVPFDSSLFVHLRKRLGMEQINAINDKIYALSKKRNRTVQAETLPASSLPIEEQVTHKGKLLVDATACPQDIAYPTDLNVLNDAREKSEELIDVLYLPELHGPAKPRTYRNTARKVYLRTAQKKVKTGKEVRVAVGKQLRFLKRNIHHIQRMLDASPSLSLSRAEYKYLLVITEVYRQQRQMYEAKTHTVEHRIVSIHQPHVRPMVRGKLKSRVEFGAKINMSMMDGFVFLDQLSWEAFNEGTLLMNSIEQYKIRNGFYPEEVAADKIYCTRENRRKLKELNIRLRAKPLGRPAPAVEVHVRPGERNPIEGKFGQAKAAYGLDKIKARLEETSESWIACIIMVLNLVKLTKEASFSLIRKLWKALCDVLNINLPSLLFQ